MAKNNFQKTAFLPFDSEIENELQRKLDVGFFIQHIANTPKGLLIVYTMPPFIEAVPSD